MIQNSKHMIAFTGAGVSTSAGIPDYRSTEETILKTGPGQWEAKGAKGQTLEQFTNKPSKYTRVETVKAVPTFSHMALSQLMKQDYLKYVISQNVDGLHRKSWIPAEKISELHGNTFLEICTKCG